MKFLGHLRENETKRIQWEDAWELRQKKIIGTVIVEMR
jgi:hypothetical protein